MLKKFKLTIAEIVTLEQELHHLLTEDSISFGIKYDITKIIEKTEAITKRFNTSKYDIIKKYGSKVEGQDDVFTLEGSEHYAKAIEELNNLANKTEVLNSELNLVDFKDMKSKYAYRVVYKLLS